MFIHFGLRTAEAEFHFRFRGVHRDIPGTVTLLGGGILTNCSMQAAAKMATTRLGLIKTSSRYSDPNATCSAESKVHTHNEMLPAGVRHALQKQQGH